MIGALLYIGIVAAVFGRALFPPGGRMLFGDDVFRYFYFFWEYFRLQLSRGVIPWWNPYIFGGMPLFANPQVSPWYPPNWIILAAPLRYAFGWYFALHICWAMLGMRKLTKSWIAGLIFGCSGFFAARVWAGHMDVIAAASWLPWVMWGFYNFLTGKGTKQPFLAAGLFALQLLAGYQTMAFFTAIAVGIMTALYALQVKSFRPLVRAAIAGISGVALAAVQILPEQELFRMSIRTYPLPYSWVSYGSWMWSSLIQLLNPFYFGTPVTYQGPPPNFIEHSAFVGIGGLILAVAGLIGLIRARASLRWMGVCFFTITIFGIWVSLGPHAPFDLQYLLWKVIPTYRYLRIPPRHLVLVVFGLAGLAGMGFASWKLPKVLTVVIAGVVTAELMVFAKSFIILRPVPGSVHDKVLIRILTSDSQPYRVLQNFGVWVPPRDQLDFDSTMSYGIFSATGYDPSILRPYYEYVANAAGQKGSEAILSEDVQVPYLTPQSADALDTLNIKYIIVPISKDPFGGAGNGRYEVLFHDPVHDEVVYENTTVKPRFYFNDADSTARVTSYAPNSITVAVDTKKDRTLYSSEIYYPGWSAYIDGKKAYINVSNGVFRTLIVPSGKHTVVYSYSPIIFEIGAGISLITLLVFVGLGRRRV